MKAAEVVDVTVAPVAIAEAVAIVEAVAIAEAVVQDVELPIITAAVAVAVVETAEVVAMAMPQAVVVE